MKKSHTLVFGALLTAGIYSCSTEEHLRPSTSGQTIASTLTITASRPGNVVPGTKTSLTPNSNNPQKGLSVNWAKNDLIKLVRTIGNQHSTTDLMLIGGAGQKNATFNGQAFAAMEGTATYQAFYPATKGGETPEAWKNNATYDGQVQRGYNDTRHLSDYDYLQTSPMETLSEDFPFYHTGIIFCFDLSMPEGTPTVPYSLTLATTDAQGAFVSNGGLFRDNFSTPTSAITLGFAECGDAVTQFQAYMTLACDIKQEQPLALILTLEDGSRYRHKLKAKEDILSPVLGEKTAGISYYIPVSTWEKVKAETYTKTTSPATSLQGNGTQESPYLISTAKELRYLVGNVSKSSGKYYRLTTDITIAENAEWKSIGSSEYKFTGHFDGNGHTIQSNLIKNSIFNYTEKNASIRNLTVVANIINETEKHIGGIVGYANNTLIVNCHYKGILTNNKTTENISIGGIAGQVNSGCTILNCTTIGEIKGENTDTKGNIHIGGIAGMIMSPGEIKNCHNYSTIQGSYSTTLSQTGGIIGCIYSANSSLSSIIGCTNYGNIYNGSTVLSHITTHTGGIAGNTINTSFIDVRNSGEVIGVETKGRNNIGGIIGSQGKATSLFRAINSGNITGYSNGKTDSRTGSLVGYAAENSGSIHQCYNEGNVCITGTIGKVTYISAYIGFGTAPLIYDCCRSSSEVSIQECDHTSISLQKCTEKHTPLQ